MKSPPVVVGIVLVVVGLLLWGAWLADSKKPTESTPAASSEFAYNLPETKNDTPSDLLIRCSEDVLDEPTEAFAKWLKLEGIPLEVPGGAMAVAKLRKVQVEENMRPAQRAVIEVLKRFSPRRVVLINHTGCIYYDTVAAWDNAYNEVLQRQEEDLRLATDELRVWLPKSQIKVYIAKHEDNRLIFRPMAEDEVN